MFVQHVLQLMVLERHFKDLQSEQVCNTVTGYCGCDQNVLTLEVILDILIARQ